MKTYRVTYNLKPRGCDAIVITADSAVTARKVADAIQRIQSPGVSFRSVKVEQVKADSQ